jgi:hypothetical protein
VGRRNLIALALAAGSLLGIGLYARRGRARQRIDLYFADGSMVSLGEDTRDAGRLIAQARDALRAART